jgi:hypothetical protein
MEKHKDKGAIGQIIKQPAPLANNMNSPPTPSLLRKEGAIPCSSEPSLSLRSREGEKKGVSSCEQKRASCLIQIAKLFSTPL